MADNKDSSRTKMLDTMPDNMMTRAARAASRMADRVGLTQEDKYKDKTKEEVATKKAKGGMIGSASKRADGCAQRGKTKGRMV